MIVYVPIRTVSEANRRDHWAVRASRVKSQRLAVKYALHGITPPRPPCTIFLTRVAKKRLDSDNLQGALKAIRDQIADWMGVDDGDERVVWYYEQLILKGGSESVRIAFTDSA